MADTCQTYWVLGETHEAWIRCGTPATEAVTTMCVHEHMETEVMCEVHKKRAQSGTLLCIDCKKHPTNSHYCQIFIMVPR